MLWRHEKIRSFTREEVDAVKMPRASRIFTPVPYGLLIDNVERAIEENGYEIINKVFHLGSGRRYVKEGGKLFAVFEINEEDEEPNRTMVIIARTSYTSEFGSSVCFGEHYHSTGCMSIRGDLGFSHRNTTNAEKFIPVIADAAIRAAPTVANLWAEAIESYCDATLEDKDAHDLIIRLYEAGVYSLSRVKEVLRYYRCPEGDIQPGTLVALQAAIMGGVFKELCPFAIADRSKILYRMFDAHAGVEFNLDEALTQEAP